VAIEQQVLAGGPLDAAELLGKGCVGFVTVAPTVRIHVPPSDQPGPFLWARGDSADDTTLIVRDPAGNWACADDNTQTANALLRISRPPLPGIYEVWIGSRSGLEPVPIQFIVATLPVRDQECRFPESCTPAY
jgi:hypothetical protein